MKPIFFTLRFRAILRRYSSAELTAINTVIAQLEQALGHPHQHSGLGIRKLKRDYFEMRVGRDFRLVFKLEKESVTFVFAGDHDEIQQFLRSL